MMNKKFSRIIALVVVLCMMFTTVAFATPGKKGYERDKKKTELKDEDYNKALLSLIEKEIVKGYGKGEYGLSGNVKRGDVIVMIIRALGLEDVDAKELSKNYLGLMTDYEDEDEDDDFEDNKDKNAYYYGPVKIAKKLGIAKGDGKYFKPNKPVTVQEVIWLIERAEDIIDDDNNIDSDKIEELTKIYDGDLNSFAKRRDVFWMLNYVLNGVELDDGEEEVKLTDIKLDMKDDSELDFLDSWFNRTFNILKKADSDVKDLEYVKFEFPIKNGTLYYDYDKDDDKNTLVNEKTKYYLSTEAEDNDKEIQNITLIPKKYFTGTIEVNYKAFDKDGKSYPGLMKITVVDGEEENIKLETIQLKMDSDDVEYIDFLHELEQKADLINKSLFDELDYVKFTSIDRGELTIDYDEEDDIEVRLNKTYYLDSIDDDLTFKYTGTKTANINFTVFDKETDKSYDGSIKITN